MLGRIRSRLTYANVTATVALLTAIAGSAMVATNLADSRSAANAVAMTANSVATMWFIGGSDGGVTELHRMRGEPPGFGYGFLRCRHKRLQRRALPKRCDRCPELSVHVDAAPGAATRKVALFGRGDSASILLVCDISGSDTTCNSGAQTVTIKPGTSLT